MPRFFTHYLPAILWAVLIFLASSIPSGSLPPVVFHIQDLILHFAVYLIFGVLLAHAADMPTPREVSLRRFMVTLGLGMLYAVSDEFHQTYVPGRYAEVSDFVADSLGIVVGMALYIRYKGPVVTVFRRRFKAAPRIDESRS